MPHAIATPAMTQHDTQSRRSRFVGLLRGDPSKAAPLTTQRLIMGVMYLLWDVTFLVQGRAVIGLAFLVLPLSWFVLAWRARAGKTSSR
jgi:hypothetical protein